MEEASRPYTHKWNLQVVSTYIYAVEGICNFLSELAAHLGRFISMLFVVNALLTTRESSVPISSWFSFKLKDKTI